MVPKYCPDSRFGGKIRNQKEYFDLYEDSNLSTKCVSRSTMITKPGVKTSVYLYINTQLVDVITVSCLYGGSKIKKICSLKP
ncbi:hypothetical protein L2E82_48025 [Cichorium intybus]|uniref:Uncharacterized protein n=1 Tax=Cichorium intybus TaxID=13427 RepID=A0ACB8YX59_CICIN|nr:hypothetical protein L2E82_48025 [Cichorium intybus]